MFPSAPPALPLSAEERIQMTSRRNVGSRKGIRSLIREFLERERFYSLSAGERRSILENLIDLVLDGVPPDRDALGLYGRIIREARDFDPMDVKVVLFGGGTGLSTILGGDSSLPEWSATPYVGLKMLFKKITVVVCSTDDGGSSGELIRRIPVIAVGDLRRAMLSGMTPDNMKALYRGMADSQVAALPGLMRKIMNHRFSGRGRTSILTLLSPAEQKLVPAPLAVFLENAWRRFRNHPCLSTIPLARHCLGNLLLISEIYLDLKESPTKRSAPCRRARQGQRCTPGHCRIPGHKQIMNGIQRFARMLGSGRRTIYPVSTTQGELRFLYSNGVVVAGEHKSSVSRRGFPVDRAWSSYLGGPRVDGAILKAVAEADLLVIAPGSVYSSLMPVLQIPEITEAVRRNRKAIKVLGANFWVQKGETDLTVRDLEKEFRVSDLIDAFSKNVGGSPRGLFRQVLCTNLRNIPAQIIQNYALEGKIPINPDAAQVEKLGFEPLSVSIHSRERLAGKQVFQHDPDRFAQSIKTLVMLKPFLRRSAPDQVKRKTKAPVIRASRKERTLFLNEYMNEARRIFDAMKIPSQRLRRILPEIVWQHRDISLAHLGFVKGVLVVSKNRWKRSTEWDGVLGYFDPSDRMIRLRRDLLGESERRLTEDILIGLGESLLGNYAGAKTIRSLSEGGEVVGKILDITLRPESEMTAFLDRARIREFLTLARLRESSVPPGVFRLVINGDESFTPPGLLFGLLYAWYLNNTFGCVVDHEMSILKVGRSSLIPKLTMEMERTQKLVTFFRREVFGH